MSEQVKHYVSPVVEELLADASCAVESAAPTDQNAEVAFPIGFNQLSRYTNAFGRAERQFFHPGGWRLNAFVLQNYEGQVASQLSPPAAAFVVLKCFRP